MGKKEVEKNVKFLMAHLEEFLQDEEHIFDKYVNYEVLHELEKELNKELQGLIAIIRYYKDKKEKENEKKYQEAIELVKEHLNDLDSYKEKYRKRLKKEKRQKKETSKKTNMLSTSEKEKNITSDVLEDLFHLRSPYMNQAFYELIVDIKRSKFIEEYYIGLKYTLPVEFEKLMAKANDLTKEEKEELSIVISDVIKNKKRSLDKRNLDFEIERDFLKEIMKSLEMLKTSACEEIQEDTTPYYNILVSLLNKDYNYYYIEKLMTENPKFIRARKGEQSILLYLVDEFIYHSRQKLMNHKKDWIEPQFYKKIIHLILEKERELSQEEKMMFFKKLEEFKDYVNKKGYVMRNEVLKDITELEEAYERKVERNEQKEKKIEQEINQLKRFKIKDAAISYIRKGYPYYEAFGLSKITNYAFSITYKDDGSINLYIHILDTPSFIEKDSILYQEMKRRKVALPKMSEKKLFPVMTFAYTLHQNKISDLKVSSSVISINTVYKERDFDNYRTIPELKMMIAFLKRLSQSKNIEANNHYQEEMEKVINGSLNMDITKSFKENKMPFIWQGQLENFEDMKRQNHNAICTELINIPKKEAHRIFRILDETPSAFYTAKDSGVIELDSTTFLGMYLLEVIHNIQFGTYDIEKVQTELKEILEILNHTEKGYYPSSIEQEDLKRIWTLSRDYKRRKNT